MYFIVITNSSEREEKKETFSISVGDDFQNGRSVWIDSYFHEVLLLPITSGPPHKATSEHARKEKNTYHITNESPDH